MNQSHANKVAIVTGASRGIGAQIARRLAQEGFAVAVNYASSAKEADALVAELEAAGSRALAVKADVASADDVRRMFDAVEAQLGPVDALINNAGVLKATPLADTSDALYDQTFNINVRGTFNTLREAAKRLNEGGRIVNFFEHDARAQHAGIRHLQRHESGRRSVHACLREGVARTKHYRECGGAGAGCDFALFDGKTDEQIANFSKMPPLERLGQPEDIASVVAFLVGKDAGWVNAQVLRANGGLA